jgi:transposase
MTPRYGRAPAGKRVLEAVKRYSKNLTIIAAASLKNMFATKVHHGAMNIERLKQWVSQDLLPELEPGEIVVWDNLRAHRNEEVTALFEKAGVKLIFLPRYSPDFSPIENCWSKIKTVLRSLKPRTFEALMTALNTALDRISESDLLGFFKHCGVLSPNST